jgi:hypothetical protein
MTSVSDRARYVLLRGGSAVPLEALSLLLDLESRGFSIRRDGADMLIRPGQRLTNADRAALRRWKAHVLQLIDYCAEAHDSPVPRVS